MKSQFRDFEFLVHSGGPKYKIHGKIDINIQDTKRSCQIGLQKNVPPIAHGCGWEQGAAPHVEGFGMGEGRAKTKKPKGVWENGRRAQWLRGSSFLNGPTVVGM